MFLNVGYFKELWGASAKIILKKNNEKKKNLKTHHKKEMYKKKIYLFSKLFSIKKPNPTVLFLTALEVMEW